VRDQVCAAAASGRKVWHELGIKLLGESKKHQLDIISVQKGTNVYGCFDDMIDMWKRDAKNGASWGQLIDGLTAVGLSVLGTRLKGALDNYSLEVRKDALKIGKCLYTIVLYEHVTMS